MIVRILELAGVRNADRRAELMCLTLVLQLYVPENTPSEDFNRIAVPSIESLTFPECLIVNFVLEATFPTNAHRCVKDLVCQAIGKSVSTLNANSGLI